MNRSLRIVIATSGNPQRAEFLDTLFPDASECDLIFVESLARAYSRIKLVNPDVVIVLFEADDVAACQLLSMLTMDEDTSGIPVETWATRPESSEFEDIIADVNHDSSRQGVVIQLN
jgi:5,10-methylene-tetrahydrofolate dehydrogenase/methenyl tetrahydrofolate cyclohydrolase